MEWIDLGEGLGTSVDPSDYAYLSKFRWSPKPRRDGKGWYAVSSRGIRMHRLIMAAPAHLVVDHIDGNGLNNVRSNLRIGTQSQNCVNRKTTPGQYLRGVRPKKGNWQAYIKYKGKQRSLGYFKTEQEAHGAYLEAANSLHGDWMPLPPSPAEEK